MYHGMKNSSVYRQYISDPNRLKYEPLSDVIKDAINIMEKMQKSKHVEDNHNHNGKDK